MGTVMDAGDAGRESTTPGTNGAETATPKKMPTIEACVTKDEAGPLVSLASRMTEKGRPRMTCFDRWRAVCIALAATGICRAESPAENGRAEIVSGPTRAVFSTNANGALASLRFGPEGRELVAPSSDLWILEAPDGSLISSSSADGFTWSTAAEETTLSWRFDAKQLNVAVRLKALGEQQGVAARWSATCGLPEGLRVAEIHFPVFRAAASIERVTSPGAFRALCSAADKVGGLYPGHSAATIQGFAAWGGGPDGLYFAAHDPEGYTKKLLWNDRAVKFTYYQPDPQQSRKEFAVPYPVVLAAFEGDWQSGLDHYRDWTRRNAPWLQRGTLVENAPEWAKNSTVWIYSASNPPMPYEELFPRLRQVFGIRGPIGVHSLWPEIQDHSNMPEGDPPAWMRAMKARQAATLKALDIHIFEYRNCHKFTKDYPGFEAARPYAVGWRNHMHVEGPYGGGADFRCRFVPAGTPGSIRRGTGVDAYGELGDQPYYLVEMCMGTAFWRNQVLKQVRPLTEYGMVGVYLDQLGYNPHASRCDVPGHGHPLRGGNWYLRSHEAMLKDVRKHFHDNGIARPLISHEFLSEPMIGLLNAALLDWDVTVLSYVYHPYVILESHEPYDGLTSLAALRENLAHDFHSGRMPSLDIPCSLPGVRDVSAVLRDKNNPADEPAFRLIRHWLLLRSRWLEYLNLGDMLHAPRLAPPSGKLMMSAWRSPDGRVALFFSNITDRPQKMAIDLNAYWPGRQWTESLNGRQNTALPAAKGLNIDRTLATDDTLILEGRPAE